MLFNDEAIYISYVVATAILLLIGGVSVFSLQTQQEKSQANKIYGRKLKKFGSVITEVRSAEHTAFSKKKCSILKQEMQLA